MKFESDDRKIRNTCKTYLLSLASERLGIFPRVPAVRAEFCNCATSFKPRRSRTRLQTVHPVRFMLLLEAALTSWGKSRELNVTVIEYDPLMRAFRDERYTPLRVPPSCLSSIPKYSTMPTTPFFFSLLSSRFSPPAHGT